MNQVKYFDEALNGFLKVNARDGKEFYADLMFNTSTGEFWYDEFCDSSGSSYVLYEGHDVINVVKEMSDFYGHYLFRNKRDINKRSIKRFFREKYPEFEFSE